MKAHHLKFFAVLLAAFSLIGCDQGRQAPSKTRVHIVNAAPSFAQLWYQREQPPGENPEALTFKAVTAHDYDVDTYDFFVYHRRVDGQELLNTWTWSKQLVADKEYTFVLAAAAGQVSPQIVEYTPKLANSSDTQIAVVHAGEALPAMDVYIQPTGVGIAGATPRGTVGFLGQITPKTFASGDYEITLTAAGDANNVLYTSSAVNLAAGITNVFVIAAEGGLGTAAISVIMAQDNSFVLYAANATSGVRAINVADDGVARDFAINHEYSPPILPAVPYGTATSYVSVPANASLPISVTPVGNPGVLELDVPLVAAAGTLNTVLFAGPAGTLVSQIVTDDRRRITSEAKLRFINAANQFTTATEIVLLPPGTTDQTTISPLTVLAAPAVTDYLYLTPGEYDLLFRETGTNTVRAGPIHVNLVSGGIYGVMTLNGPDTATATVVFIDDTP
jgi:hypothetical protein